MQISRSITIEAPVDVVYQSILDFKEWPKWSPWLIAEPQCEVTYADDGKSYSWNGEFVGSGQMMVVDSRENESIHYDLQFLKPWKSFAKVAMLLEPVGSGTKVTWEMDSSLPFFMFFLKKMMEGFIGMDYERGLSMLKDLLETGEVPVKLEFGETEVQPITLFGRGSECAIKDMPRKMVADIDLIHDAACKNEFVPKGKMYTIYHKWDVANGRVRYTTGYPVDEVPATLPEGFVTEEIPQIKAFTSQLTGPYRHLGNAWAAGIMRSRNGAFKQSRKVHPFEVYDNDPTTVEENDLMTTVHFPIRRK